MFTGLVVSFFFTVNICTGLLANGGIVSTSLTHSVRMEPGAKKHF